jgi:hypothetical protein
MKRKPMSQHFLLLFLLSATLLSLAACVNRLQVGDLQRKTESVALEGAEEVDVEIAMGAGELTLDGGADGLMSAEFAYNVGGWEPEVSYSVSGNTGTLRLEQPSFELENFTIPDGDIRYEWDVRLGDGIPLSLDVRLGAGNSQFDLKSLDVRSMNLQTGAGDVTLDLGGTLSDLEIQMGAGQMQVDLSGNWQQDLDATIRGGVGRLTVRLPDDVGVRLEVNQGLGNVTATGLSRDNNTYVNSAYGDSDVTLNIAISGGVGEIVLDVSG